MKSMAACFTACILAVGSARGARGGEALGSDISELLESIEELEHRQREEALGMVASELRKLETEIIGRFEKATNTHVRLSLAFLMGRYRFARAAQPLAHVIELENPRASLPSIREPLLGQYPVAGALARIGHPGARAVLDRLRDSDDDVVHRLSAKVFPVVWGADTAVLILKHAISKEEDADKKARLEVVLRHVLAGGVQAIPGTVAVNWPRTVPSAATLGSFHLGPPAYHRAAGGGAQDAIGRMVEQRRQNMSVLLDILERGPSKCGNTEVAQAIRTLGELRAAEAATELVRYISFEPDPKRFPAKGGYPDTERQWPAVGALVKIGLPAVEPLVDLMVRSSDERETTLADIATLMILGYDMRNTYLRAKIRETDDEQRGKKLRSFIVSAPTERKQR